MKEIIQNGLENAPDLFGETELESAKLKILTAAIEVFESKGFAGARMQEIAEKAEVNKALIHYYFKNKEGLYLEVLDLISGTFWRLVESIDASHLKNGAEFIDHLVGGFFALLIANPSCKNLLLKELAQGGPFLKCLPEESAQNCDRKFVSMIQSVERLMDLGWLKKSDPMHLIFNIEALVMGSFVTAPFAENGITHPIELNQDFYTQRALSVATLLKEGVLGDNN